MRFGLFSKFSGTALFSCINLAINMFQSKNTHNKKCYSALQKSSLMHKNIYRERNIEKYSFLVFFE